MSDNSLTLEQVQADSNAKIEALTKTVEALTQQLSIASNPDKKQEKPTIPANLFEVDGNKYKFLLPQFKVGKDVITATDALTSPEILQYLVRRKSGCIQEVIQ